MRPIIVIFLPAVIIFIFTVINAHALMMAIKYVIAFLPPRRATAAIPNFTAPPLGMTFATPNSV